MVKFLRVGLLITKFLLFAWISSAQELDSTMWVTNGEVSTVVKAGNSIYIAGDFTQIGSRTGGGGIISTSTGLLEENSPKINGRVLAAVADGNGGWYIGGDFTHVGDVQRKSLAHINSDYSLDLPWNPGVNGEVTCIAYSDNTVFIGGKFIEVDGKQKQNFASIDALTGKVTDWNPAVPGNFSYVSTLAISNDIIYAGGNFNSIDGKERNNLVSFQRTTGLVTDWNPNADLPVSSLLIHQNIIYAGGNFNSIGGLHRNYLAALDAVTGQATTWNAEISGQGGINQLVSNMLIDKDLIYITGNFESIGGQPIHSIASIDIATAQPTSLTTDIFGNNGLILINTVAISGNTIYVGGNFSEIGEEKRNYIAALDATTGQVRDWNPCAGELVKTLSFSGGKLFAGGNFNSIGSPPRQYLAALDALTGKVTPWNPQPNNYVNTIAALGNTIYVGGRYDEIGGQYRNGLTALNAVTGQALNWKPDINLAVSHLKIYKNNLYATGSFRDVNGVYKAGIVVINPTTTQIKELDTNFENSSYVGPYFYDIEISGNLLYVGGEFKHKGSKGHKNIAAFNLDTGLLTPWFTPIDDGSAIWAICATDSVVYAGGRFSMIGGQERNNLAALDATTGLATPWNPDLYGGVVMSIKIWNKDIYIGGYFTGIGEQRRQGLAAINTTTGQATPWIANVSWHTFQIPRTPRPYDSYEGVSKILVSENTMYVAGDFGKINSTVLGGGFAAFGERPGIPTNTISGNIFQDTNANCLKEPGEKGIENFIVVAEPGPFYATTDTNGNYSLTVNKGTYTISQLVPENKGLLVKQICPATTTHTVSLDGENQHAENINFSNQVVKKPYLTIDIASDRRRRCFRSTTTIIYKNEGYISASNVHVKVILPPYVVPISSSIPWSSRKDSVLIFNIGTMEAGISRTITLIDSVICGNESIRGLTQCTKAIITPTNDETDTRWDQSSVALKAVCKDNGFVRLAIQNTGAGHMADSTAYRIYLDAVQVFAANYKLRSGDSLILEVPVNGKTIRLEADQRPYHPGNSQPSITIEGCGGASAAVISKGFVDVLPQDDAAENVEISCMPIMDSYDPNDKTASPAGVTANHIITAKNELEYLIRFQNTGNDVAYNISIEDVLDEHLDIATLQIGTSSHPFTWKVTGEGLAKITWTFANINLPDSTSNEPGSHGFVKFKIAQKTDNSIGTVIKNKADIYFDFNSAVTTNETVHTVGELPVSTAKIIINTCGTDHPSEAKAGNDIILQQTNAVSLQAITPLKGSGTWKVIKGSGIFADDAKATTIVSDLAVGENIFEWAVTLCDQVLKDSIRIERVVLPSFPTVSLPAPYCAGEKIQPITATGTEITWYANATLTIKIGQGNIYQPVVSQTDTLYVTQQVNGYESLAKEVVLTIKSRPAAPKIEPLAYTCAGNLLAPLVATGNDITWYADAGLKTKLREGNNFDQKILTEAIFVTQKVDGCESIAAKVTIQPGGIDYNKIRVANILTPNGDNKNDTFSQPQFPEGVCIGDFTGIQIYNRWGKTVFESKDPHFAWTPLNLSNGVYFYSLQYSNFNYTGSITILH